MKITGQRTLDALVKSAQNGVTEGQQLITAPELAELKSRIASGELPVWKVDGGTSLGALAGQLEGMALLPEERQAARQAIEALRSVGEEHAAKSELGANFASLWPRLTDKAIDAAGLAVDVGRVVSQKVGGPPRLSATEIDAAKDAAPDEQAALLYRLISPFADPEARAGQRVEQLERLLDGMTGADVAALRQAYVQRFGVDPFHHITGGSLAQPLLAGRLQGSLNLKDLARRFAKTPGQGFENVEDWAVKTYQDIIGDPKTGPSDAVKALATAWLSPELKEDAQLLASLLDKVQASQPLTVEERREYFARMPFVGIRTRSDRPGNEPTYEEAALQKVWSAMGHTEDLGASMASVEAAFPEISLPAPRPDQKSVAVVVSSQGAQWQELMGYVMEMERHDVHVQFFTPEGRPAAFQRDSLARSNTATIGYGAPEALDPAGPTGAVARELLGDAVGASRFQVEDFDQVYVAGGLGLNEDGVRVEPADPEDRRTGQQRSAASVYEAHPDLARMINEAAAEQTPVLAICHGPSTFLADNVHLDVKGTHMAALGPFEAYVAYTGRTGRPFPHMALVHNDARRAGVEVDPVRDALKPGGVVRDTARTAEGEELVVVTGPHPASAGTLGRAGLELLGIAGEPADYLYRG